MKKKHLNLSRLMLKKATITCLHQEGMESIHGGSATCAPVSTDAVSICRTGCPSIDNDCPNTIANKKSQCCADWSMAYPAVSVCNPCIPEHTQPLLCA